MAMAEDDDEEEEEETVSGEGRREGILEDGGGSEQSSGGAGGARAVMEAEMGLIAGEELDDGAGVQRRGCGCACSPRGEAVVARVHTFLINQFLPVGLLVALTIGVTLPAPGVALASVTVGAYPVFSTLCIFFVFFLSGIAIQSKEVRSALRAGKATIFALVSILIITPCAGFAAMNLGIEPKEFQYGMAVFSCVPTTLTSGVALVSSAGGNSVLALLLTVGSNLIGVGTVPFVAGLVLASASSSSASVDPVPLLVKLLISVLAPLVVGSLARANIEQLARFAKARKKELSMFSNFLLMLIVWQTVSKSSNELRSVRYVDFFILLAWAITLHASYLLFNGVSATVLRLEAAEWIAVVLLASQKTLPVTISILSFLPESEVGEQGLLAVPPIIGHISQLIIDSCIVSCWVVRAAAKEEALKKAGTELLRDSLPASDPVAEDADDIEQALL